MTIIEKNIYSHFSNGNSIATFKLLVYKLDTGDAIFNIFPYIHLTDINMGSRIIGLKMQSFIYSYNNDCEFKNTVKDVITNYTGEIIDNIDGSMIITVPAEGITITLGCLSRPSDIGVSSIIISNDKQIKEFLVYTDIDNNECNIFTRITKNNSMDILLYQPFKYDKSVKLYDPDSLKTLPEFSTV